MRQIAIYGKGGIGKSTITSNLSAALACKGNKILQIGCDPKQDSTRTLLGFSLSSVLDVTKKQGTSFTVDDIIKTGFAQIDCVESGGPNPGVGCAGRGIILVMDILKKLGVFARPYNYIFYDVLGDVVCGGFAVPIRYSYAQEVYIVASGEFMSLYAANNIAKAIKHYGENGKVKLGGIIGNYRNVKNEEFILEEFSKKLGTRLIYAIPRDNIVQEAESLKKTVIEHSPDSNQAKNYQELSQKIENNKKFVIPTPFEDAQLEEFYFLSVNQGK